nr:reverse transcriptase domain-containing protein [Tanacetum cinerariifolium]
MEDPKSNKLKDTPYELLKDDEKKQLSKYNEAKMTLYNSLPRKEYERVFMCKTTKEVWHTIMITHQGNSQVKDYKIDLLIQQMRSSQSQTTQEKVKSLALKAKVTRKQSSDDSESQRGSDEDEDEDEEFNLMARNFRKFFWKGHRFGKGGNRFGRGCGNGFEIKAVEAQDKSTNAIIAGKKVTSLGWTLESRSKKEKSIIEEDELSQPWVCKETDPFTPSAKVERWAMPTLYHMFNFTLTGSAMVWSDDLPPEFIDSCDDLKKAFLANYLQQKKCIKDPIEIHHIKQREGESLENFMQRFKAESRHVK